MYICQTMHTNSRWTTQMQTTLAVVVVGVFGQLAGEKLIAKFIDPNGWTAIGLYGLFFFLGLWWATWALSQQIKANEDEEDKTNRILIEKQEATHQLLKHQAVVNHQLPPPPPPPHPTPPPPPSTSYGSGKSPSINIYVSQPKTRNILAIDEIESGYDDDDIVE